MRSRSTLLLESRLNIFDDWQVDFRATIRERLNGEPMDDAPKWAHDILATFLIHTVERTLVYQGLQDYISVPCVHQLQYIT